MNQKKLTGKVAVITGGSKGIGRAIALAFAAEGAGVVIASRTAGDLQKVRKEIEEIGGLCLPITADVSVESDVNHLMDEAAKTFNRIDLLVNNVGIPGPMTLLPEISKAEWDEIITTNVTGMFLCSRAALIHMIKQRSGNIINLSSGAGRLGGFVRSLPYNVSKFAVEGFTYGLAEQMKPYGICVNAIRPGRMDTDFHKHSPPEIRMNLRKAEDIVNLAVHLALQTVNTMTGQSIDLAEWEKSRSDHGLRP